MRLRFFIISFLALFCGSATLSADGYSSFYSPRQQEGSNDGYRSTSVWWKDWAIRSSEELYETNTSNFNNSLINLFDNDPKTAWVDGNPRRTLRENSPWRTRFGLALNSEASVRLSGLRILNGYNKRRDLFLRNDRIIQMQIWINGRKVKTANLSDRMGWHEVSFPSNNVRELGLLFTGIRRGRGRDNDVCISELELYNNGRKIDMKMPGAVFFENGNQSGDAPLDCAFISVPDGKVISQGIRPFSGLETEKWNADGRYVCSAWRSGNEAPSGREKSLIWIADLKRQKIIKRELLPDRPNDDSYSKEIIWLDNRTVEVRWIEYEYSGNTETNTIKFRKQYRIQ